MVRVPILSYLCVVFGNSIVFASCSRLRFLDIRFGIFVSWSKFLISWSNLNFFFEIKSRVWVLIKHYSCLVVSCFLFVFCFFCASEFPFLIWYAQNVKKNRFTRSLFHRNVTLSRPNLQKKKRNWSKKKKKSVSLCYLLFVSISYWVFFSCVLFVFRICDCVRLIRIWLGFWFWVN